MFCLPASWECTPAARENCPAKEKGKCLLFLKQTGNLTFHIVPYKHKQLQEKKVTEVFGEKKVKYHNSGT
jgi:hypothetical protein